MKPKRIFLVRHGESTANADLKVYETVQDYRVPLSPLGHLQARAAGEKLRDVLRGERVGIYGSPFHRTRQTRNGITAALDPVQIAFVREDPRIREQEYGHLRSREEGKKIERELTAYGAFYYRVPDGESGADCYDRCSCFIDSLFREFEKPHFPENVLLVTHGLALRLFLMRWFHWSPEEFARMRHPENCQIVTLEKAPCGHYRLTEPYPQLPESEWPPEAHELDTSPQVPSAHEAVPSGASVT